MQRKRAGIAAAVGSAFDCYVKQHFAVQWDAEKFRLGNNIASQYGFTFSDAPCIAANGFTGAANSPIDVIEFSSCDFNSRSGSLISNSVSVIREIKSIGGSFKSLGPAQPGHGFQTVVSGAGSIDRVFSAGTMFESYGGSGFAGAFLAGRSGAALKAHMSGVATKGANQWGLRIDEGVLTHSPIDAAGFSTSATVAGTGGTLVTY
jgi:hypothetical protein